MTAKKKKGFLGRTCCISAAGYKKISTVGYTKRIEVLAEVPIV
jgi:hypothetical protein